MSMRNENYQVEMGRRDPTPNIREKMIEKSVSQVKRKAHEYMSIQKCVIKLIIQVYRGI